MRMLRFIPVPAMAFAFATLLAQALLAQGPAQAQKITVGKTTGGSGFHTPSYIAMDKGFYKAEGLDASFVTLTGRALVTAGLSGSVDFIPIPSGGSQAALSGAEIRYVVGQSLKSQWLIAARPEITKPEDLKGKTVGYGRAGSADYDEGAAVMQRAFKMEVGKDYKVISFQGEPAPIPEHEIESIRRLVESDLAYDPCPLIHEGMCVEVKSGPLKGVVGRLTRKNEKARLVLSVDLIGQAVSVEVDAADVRPY